MSAAAALVFSGCVGSIGVAAAVSEVRKAFRAPSKRIATGVADALFEDILRRCVATCGHAHVQLRRFRGVF
jgi:hypothetical protein